MRLAVIGEVLGDDRQLREILARLSRRGISAQAVISLGNMIGPYGDSRRCLEMARDFALCLQGPLERLALGQAVPGMEAGFRESVYEIGARLPRDLLGMIAEWPGSLVWPLPPAPPLLAFLGSHHRLLDVPEACRFRFCAAHVSYLFPSDPSVPVPSGSETMRVITMGEDDPFSMRHVIRPRDGGELDVRTLLPVTVFLGARRDFTSLHEEPAIAVWTLDDTHLGHWRREHTRPPLQPRHVATARASDSASTSASTSGSEHRDE